MGGDFETGAQTSTLGYDRAAVDAFLAAAAEERQKLERQIEQANLRLAKARTALGTHRVMVAMLLETQRELSTIRRDAELQAAAIIAAAERDARERQGSGAGNRPTPSHDGSIDLTDGAARSVFGPSDEPALVSSPAGFTTGDMPFGPAEHDAEFFEYLRGALSDDEPLGPRIDDGGLR